MKNKILTAITVTMCLAAGVVQPLRAQGTKKISRSAPRSGAMYRLAPDPAEQVAGGQYPPQTLEDLRRELLNLADSVQEFAALAPAELVDIDSLQQARLQIQQMPPEYLNTLRKTIDPAKLHDRLLRARSAVGEYSKGISGTKMIAGSMPSYSPGFPNANGSCTSANGTDVNRIPTAVVLAADVVFFVADTVRELAQDACKETVVIAGEGGNTSLACTIVDTVWVVAKAVDLGIHFCDDDLTGAVVDANFARLNHIHDDLAAVQTGVTTIDGNTSNVGAQISGVDTHLSNVDAHISSEIAAHELHMTMLLGVLQASVDLANQRLLKTIAGEAQIMKLELTPEAKRIVAPSILTCTGLNCPTDLLANCTGPGGACTWNNVGPLP